MERYPLWIGGQWRSTAAWTTVQDPATGEPVGEVAVADGSVTTAAIEAAAAAFADWARRPARERAALLTAMAAAIRSTADHLAAVLTAEQGKPLAEARAEVLMSADYFEWNGEEAKRLYGEQIPASHGDKRLWAWRQPVGVAAAITPWNFPSSMIARKVAPALAAGCPVVVKPALQTPLSALELARLAEQVGLPAGVFNVVVGPAEPIADALFAHPAVRKISFTGSTAVGQQLMARAAGDLKRVSLELGGHAPFIVLDDADLEAAVEGVVASKFRNAGQTCICANRLYVQEGIYAAFAERLAARTAALKVGVGREPGVEVGPLINAAALNKVARQVADAQERGGRVLVGGTPVRVPGASGYFYAPTVVDAVPPDALVAREETFGPLLGMWRFADDAEAVHWANHTPYGLAAYLYGRDIGRVVRIAEALEYGVIGINDPVPTVVQAPFGGMKHSGFGREGGHQGLDEYLEWKFVSVRL